MWHVTIIWLSCCDYLSQLLHVAVGLLCDGHVTHGSTYMYITAPCDSFVWLLCDSWLHDIVWLSQLSHDWLAGSHVIFMWQQCSNVLILIDNIETTFHIERDAQQGYTYIWNVHKDTCWMSSWLTTHFHICLELVEEQTGSASSYTYLQWILTTHHVATLPPSSPPHQPPKNMAWIWD